jgi:nitrous oxidase accessory protein NosD
MLNKKIIVLSIIVLFIGVGFTGSTYSLTMNRSQILSFEGNILYVGGSGPGNYSSIQDAIDNASDGDTVFVFDDSSPYIENLIIKISISLIGENKETTVIDGDFNDGVIKICKDNIQISGFTITNSKNGYSGINIKSNSNIIDDNTFINNYIGILFIDSSIDNIVTFNSFIDNLDGVVFMDASKKNQILHCDFINNTGGVCFFGCHRYSKVSYCVFSGNKHDIEADQFTLFNKIYYNNFMGQGIVRYWMFFNFNLYYKNYWYDWNGIGPYRVSGFFNWDWFPIKEPYDITTAQGCGII